MKMMKVCFTFLTALVVLTALAGRSSAANLLLNGNLDNTLHVGGGASGQTPDNWTLDEFKTNSGPTTDLIDLEAFAGSVGANTNPGDLGGFVKAFQGNNITGDWANLNMYQDVPAVPGLTYQFAGFIGAGSNYSGLLPGSPTQTLLTIEFDNDNNRANGVLSSVTTNVGPSLTPGSGQPGWNAQIYSATGTAPAGTLFVRGVFSALNMFSQPNPDPSAFVDDFSMQTVVPEPTTIGLSLLGLVGMIGLGRRRG
ncbi:MAG TPA: PEP-CTERM sorting domain-containing protein [Lacipirellulaceae bacterium]|jgi:hypothetical protein|nr:PEP-CTERM sorting domain-containing protein [Lacipirellulaceae bacterium]